MSQQKIRQKNGFTIVELLIVIVVIGILAAITLIAYNGIQIRAAGATLQSDLHQSANRLATNKAINGQYDDDASGLPKSSGTSYQYHRTVSSSVESFCLTATSSRAGVPAYNITQEGDIRQGACPGDSDGSGSSGGETAPVMAGGNVSIGGYTGTQPRSCPSSGGSWIKVPGNSLYGTDNGFCVQQYPASNVGGIATSQATGNRWTALTQLAARASAEAITAGSHLLSENEWMTIASNAAQQGVNWTGGSVGSGTLPTGSSSASFGGVAVTLSNGSVIHFDTGGTAYYATYEWTCYTGPGANNCGLAATDQPQPANAYYTDQFKTAFGTYGRMAVNGSGYYYGDPRYANPSLDSYVSSSRSSGLGYLRSSYASGSSTVFAPARGFWNGANSSGLFTLYLYTNQAYAHAQYGFRAAY